MVAPLQVAAGDQAAVIAVTAGTYGQPAAAAGSAAAWQVGCRNIREGRYLVGFALFGNLDLGVGDCRGAVPVTKILPILMLPKTLLIARGTAPGAVEQVEAATPRSQGIRTAAETDRLARAGVERQNHGRLWKG